MKSAVRIAEATVGTIATKRFVLASVAWAVAFALLGALVSLHLVALNPGFYRSQHLLHNVAQRSGVSEKDMNRASDALIQYFSGKRPSPQIEAEIQGALRPMYGDRELIHLEDVANLVSAGLALERILAVIVAGLGLVMVAGSRNLRYVGKALLGSGALLACIIAFLALAARIDFSSLWTRLHEMTFSNDLWMLDPAKDYLIRMFPEEFFYGAVRRFALYCLSHAGLSIAAGLLIGHFAPDHGHKNR